MEVTLSVPQSEIFSCKDRYRVVVAGRRFGKSYLAAIELIQFATEHEGSECWYVAPTYRMAKMILWPVLKNLIPQHCIEAKNEQELMLKLKPSKPGGKSSTIVCKGVDNPDSLRGASISFIVLDEFQDIDPEAWFLVLMPACADQRAPALFIGTPKGFNHFYDFSLKGGVDKGWSSFRYTTAEGGMVEEEELEMARHNMSPRQYAQEFLASFETLSNRVFYAFSREEHLDPEIEWDGSRTIHVGLDFNVSIMAGVCAYLDEHKNLMVFDEIALENSNTPEICELLHYRYPKAEIIVYPDPAGKSRSTKSLGGSTDHSILEGAGFTVVAPRSHLSNADGFSNVNYAFKNAAGEVSLKINPRCKHLIKTCEGWTFKKDTEIADKDSGLDHHGDSLKYLVNEVKPVISNRLKKVKILGF